MYLPDGQGTPTKECHTGIYSTPASTVETPRQPLSARSVMSVDNPPGYQMPLTLDTSFSNHSDLLR